MVKSNTKIFIIFTIFCIIVSCSCNSNKREQTDNGTNSTFLKLPDAEIYDFSYKHSDKDQIVWELFSKKALVFKRDDVTKIEGVNLNFYKSNRVDTTLLSKYGEVYELRKLLSAISNVVLTTSDNTVLYTDILHWDDNRKILYTDEFVKIVKPNGDIIQGIGMEADNNLERMVIKKDVKGEFHK